MNKRDARREAAVITARLLDNYLDVGQPYEECQNNSAETGHPDGQDECGRCRRIGDAIVVLRDRLDRLAGRRVTA